MIIKNCLDKIFNSKGAVKCLRYLFLYPEKGATGSEMASACSISLPTVLEIVKSLKEQNIITSARIGKAWLIKANKESILYGVLSNLFSEEGSITNLSMLRYAIQNELGHLLAEAILFGSVAKGTEEPNSDIDILLITKNTNLVEPAKKIVEEKIMPIIEKKFGNLLSCKIISQEEFIKSKNVPYIKDLLIEGNHKIISLGGGALWH